MTGLRTHRFRAMNTEWWLRADLGRDLEEGEAIVRDAEARLSRFREDSALSRLNRDRSVEDWATAAVLRRALELRALTGGAFDPAIGQALLAAGYTRSFEELRAAGPPPLLERGAGPTATIKGDRVSLDGGGLIDLGGIAKGWTVDRVASWLEERGAQSYVVDGGGDIRVAGVDCDGQQWALGVGDDSVVRIGTGALCTSSRRVRRWGSSGTEAHHIIDPATRQPAAGEIEEAAVIAEDATTADALTTALVADSKRGLAAVERLEAAAMVRWTGGTWWITARMTEYLA